MMRKLQILYVLLLASSCAQLSAAVSVDIDNCWFHDKESRRFAALISGRSYDVSSANARALKVKAQLRNDIERTWRDLDRALFAPAQAGGELGRYDWDGGVSQILRGDPRSRTIALEFDANKVVIYPALEGTDDLVFLRQRYRNLSYRLYRDESGYQRLQYSCKNVATTLVFGADESDRTRLLRVQVDLGIHLPEQLARVSNPYINEIERRRREQLSAELNSGEREFLAQLLGVASDDDWLTGVTAEGAGAGLKWQLVDRVAGLYRYRGCSPRYTETRPVKSLKRQGDSAIVTEYRLDQRQLSDDNLQQWVVARGTWEQGREDSFDGLLDVARFCQPASGADYWREAFARQRAQVEAASDYPQQVLTSEVLFAERELLGEIENVHRESLTEGRQLAVYRVALMDPPRSGHCGASADRGYYFVRRVNGAVQSERLEVIDPCYQEAELHIRVAPEGDFILQKKVYDFDQDTSVETCRKVLRADLRVLNVTCPEAKT